MVSFPNLQAVADGFPPRKTASAERRGLDEGRRPLRSPRLRSLHRALLPTDRFRNLPSAFPNLRYQRVELLSRAVQGQRGKRRGGGHTPRMVEDGSRQAPHSETEFFLVERESLRANSVQFGQSSQSQLLISVIFSSGVDSSKRSRI